MRKGVKFHDGGDFTAEDVKFSYEVALRPDSTSDMKGVFTNFVQSVDVVNPYRVVFNMKAPNWEIIYKFLETLLDSAIASISCAFVILAMQTGSF